MLFFNTSKFVSSFPQKSLRLNLTSQCIFMAVKSETGFDLDEIPRTGKAPPLTVKQNKLLSLVNYMDKSENFPGYVDDLLNMIMHGVFPKRRLERLRIGEMGNLIRFYVAICKIKGIIFFFKLLKTLKQGAMISTIFFPENFEPW